MKRQFLVALLALAVDASQIVAIPAASDASMQDNVKQSKQDISGDHMTVAQREALGKLSPSISVDLDDRDVPFSLRGSLCRRVNPDDPVAEAESALETFGTAFRRGDKDGFTYSNIRNDRAGNIRVEMAQSYKGFAVIGKSLVVSLSRNEVIGISGNFVADLKVKTRPVITRTDAADFAQSRLRDEGRQDATVIGTGEPVIFVDETMVGHLAIPAQVTYSEAETPKSEELFIEARRGLGILGRHPIEAKEASGTIVPRGPVIPNYLLNPGFENQPTNGWSIQSAYTSGPSISPTCSAPLSDWFPSTDVIVTGGQPLHGGLYKAWLGGWGYPRQDSVSQILTLPAYNPLSGVSRATLSLWIAIETSERRGRPGFPASSTGTPDYMYVEVFNLDSPVGWQSLGYYDSFYPAGTFIQQSGDLTRFLGKRIIIRFRSCEDALNETSLYLDDLAVTVGP